MSVIGTRPWAICVTLTDELLNRLAAVRVADGVVIGPFAHQVEVPMMGSMTLDIGLTIVSVRAAFSEHDAGRIRLEVIGDGTIGMPAGEPAAGSGPAPAGMTLPTMPVRVVGEVLIPPVLRVDSDDTLTVGLDAGRAELLTFAVDHDAPTPEGMDPAAHRQMLQVAQMMLTMTGEELFGLLAEQAGTVGITLGPEDASVLIELGVATGEGEVFVGNGVLTLALPAVAGLEGRAEPVPIGGPRLGVAVASGRFDRLAQRLLEAAVGDLPLPFELELDLSDQRVGGVLRNARLTDRLPDLRPAVRSTLRVRLRGGRLELIVESAWVELPLVPAFVNRLNRQLGSLVSFVPIRFRLPTHISLPPHPEHGHVASMRADDLRVTPEGVGVTLMMETP